MKLSLKKTNYVYLLFYGVIFEFLFLVLSLMIFYKDYIGDTLRVPSIRVEIIQLFLGWGLIISLVYSGLIIRKFSKDSLLIIILFFFLFSLTLAVSWPFGSSDIFNYVYRARIFTNYNLNPFLTPPATFPNDVMDNFVFSHAKYYPMIYGPLWTMISFIPNFIFGSAVDLAILSFKLIAIGFNFGCLILIYKILSNVAPNFKYLGTLAYAWNPLILFESAQNGHNDFILVFLVLVALYLLIKKKFDFVLPILTLSLLVKYVTIILFPVFIIYLLKEKKITALGFWFKNFLLCLLLVILFYLPFWSGTYTLQSFLNLSDFWGDTLLPSIIKYTFGFSQPQIKTVVTVIFAVVYLFLISWAAISPKANIFKVSYWVLLSFILVYLSWVNTWYFVWVLPFSIILISDKRYLFLTLLLTTVCFFAYYATYIVAFILLLPIFIFFAKLFKHIKPDNFYFFKPKI